MDKIRLGVSSCLLGERVRYDGQHRLDPFLRDTLGRWVEYVPVCPEVECGLPVPREAMRLVGDPSAPRLLTVNSGRDLTAQMERWIEVRLRELEREQLDGFIFKARSPSSGMERVKIYDREGRVKGRGAGLFAAAFMQRFPLLPVEDEGRLRDPGRRESFIERLFVMHRWRRMLGEQRGLGGLVAFHTRHKLLILAHSPAHYRELGRLVAAGQRHSPADLLGRYQRLLMEGLELKATPAKNSNVLYHAMGHFKRWLSTAEKEELRAQIAAYRRGDIPLLVPITILAHYIRKYRPPFLLDQVYLSPHPTELRLRNHA